MKLKKGIACMMAGALVMVSLFQGTPAQAAKKVAISKKTAVLYTGKTLKLKIKNTKKKVKWSSSNKKIATVSSKGLVKAKKKGKVTITAKVAKKKYTCKITVKEKKTVKPTTKPKATATTKPSITAKPNQTVSPSPTNSGGTNDNSGNGTTTSPNPSNGNGGNGGNAGTTSSGPSGGNSGNTSTTAPKPSNGNGGTGNMSTISPNPSGGNGSGTGSTVKPSSSAGNSGGTGNTATPSPSTGNSGGTGSTATPSPSAGNSGGTGSTATPSPSAGNGGGTGSTATPSPSPSAGTSGGGNTGGSDVQGSDLQPSTMLNNLSVGMTKTDVTNKYGNPTKTGKSPHGFDTYAYYNNQYKYFILVSFEADKVVSFFGMGKDVAYKTAVASGTTSTGLTDGWSSYSWFKATNTSKGDLGAATFENTINGEKILAFTDSFVDKKVFAIQVFSSSYSADDISKPSSKLSYDSNVVESMENEIFCMINVYRVIHGFDIFERNSKMDSVAKEESEELKQSGIKNVEARDYNTFFNAIWNKGVKIDYCAESPFNGSVDSIGFFVSAILMKECQADFVKILSDGNAYDLIGVGCACDENGSSGKTYMTLEFALSEQDW